MKLRHLVPRIGSEYWEYPGEGPQVVMRARWLDWFGRRWFEVSYIQTVDGEKWLD